MSAKLSKDDRLVICRRLLEMGLDPSEVDLDSWAHLAQDGSDHEENQGNRELPLTDSERLTVARRLLEMGLEPSEVDLQSWAHLARGVKRPAPNKAKVEEDAWADLKDLGKSFLAGVAEAFEDETDDGASAQSSDRRASPGQPVRSGTPSPIDENEELSEDEKSVVGAFILMGFALGYFVFPIDLIPDALLGVGQVDDLGIAGVAGANLVQAYMAQGVGFLEAAVKALKWLVALVAVGVVSLIVIVVLLAQQL